jgi:hypothetical protein
MREREGGSEREKETNICTHKESTHLVMYGVFVESEVDKMVTSLILSMG